MLHLAAIAAVLTLAPTRPMMVVPESLTIEFAEIELAPPPRSVPVEPLEETTPPEPAPSEPKPEAALPKPEPEPAPPSNPLPAVVGSSAGSGEPSVLTQNGPGAAAPAEGETGEATDTVSDAQIANVLKLLGCQKLRDHRGDDCPDADPFTASAAVAERNTVKPKEWADSDYINKTVMEQFLDREARARFHWPDADLFADPMPPGAYNAQRIRDGREPLWSKEMRDGFRKKDTDEN